MTTPATLSAAQIDLLVRDQKSRIHFVGIGGTGMSAYADFRALSGGVTSGSDRGFDQGKNLTQRDGFISRGIQVFAQDGSGIAGAAAIVVSATIEPQVPDYATAVSSGVPVISRKDWLAAHYRVYDCIAITGTSGKSTVTALVFDLLRGAGRDPSLIAGADLRSLLASGKSGNAAAGLGPLVLEADESDKGIMDYTPTVGVILNLQRDHDEPEKMLPAFAAFKANCKKVCVISDDGALEQLRDHAVMVGQGAACAPRITQIELAPDSSTFLFDGVRLSVPLPGEHNVQNAGMALAACMAAGVPLKDLISPLANFQGVARRFEIVGNGNGIEVVDDYAHNPAKIAAVIKNTHLRSERSHIWFQPHGFGPTRFMRKDVVAMFAATLRPQDELYIAPIYYAGGTVAQDISSNDLIADLAALGRRATLAPQDDFVAMIRAAAGAGDCIAIIGGRDPLLPAFAKRVADAVTR